MGIFHTLYRELRDIMGLSPPPETETLRAERVCGEVKSELGGKRIKNDDDYILTTELDGRAATISFEAYAGRAVIEVATNLRQDLEWEIVADPQSGPEPIPRGFERVYVTSGIYVEGPSNSWVLEQQTHWKLLPTGARGVATQLLQKTYGKLEFIDGTLKLTPEVETIAGKSARYNVKSHLQSMVKIASGVEEGWR